MKTEALTSLCVALLLLMVVPTVGASDAVVAQEVETQMESSSEPVEVVVNLEELSFGELTTQQIRKQKVRSSQQALLDHIESKEGIRVLNRFWITNSVLVEIEPKYDYERLTRIDGVRSLKPNTRMELLDATSPISQNATASTFTETSTATDLTTTTSTDATYGIEQINATDVWSQYNTKGDGIKVAVLDTGVNVSHPDIGLYTADPSDPTYPGGWAEFDEYGNEITGSTPHDTGSHGTHVSGTVAGQHTGVAPNASLMHALVIDAAKGGSYAQAIGGLQWAVENDADVVSMSLGGPADSRWIDAVDNANQMGTIVVAATGNYPDKGGDGNSATPGNVYDVIGVGAVDNNLDVTTFSGGEVIDTSSTWGSSAPDDWPSEYVVPDVVAAGLFVNSTSSSGGYETMSGTSMATPHVAGATALALSAAGGKSPESVSDAFALTAFGSGSEKPGTRYGHGAADALGVTEHLLDTASVSGTVVDTSGSPIKDAKVTVEGLRVDSTGGDYDAGLSSGSWNLQASASGYQDATKTVVLGQDENVQKDIQLQQVTTPNFDISIDSTNSPVGQGSTLTVYATVQNVGGATGTQSVELTVGGNLRDSTEVTLDSGQNQSVQLDWATGTGDAGDYTATVKTENDTDTVPVKVRSDVNFEATIDSTNSPIFVGETLKVVSTIQNTGDQGTGTVSLEVGGTQRDGATVTLGSNDKITKTFEWATQNGDSGDYTAKVKTGTDAATQAVTVGSMGNTPPTASFSYSPDSPDTSDPITFDASSSSDSDGSIQSYDWDFGDGTTATGASPTHLYSSSGPHAVTLTVTDDDGATDTATQAVSVADSNTAPTASFDYTPNSPGVSESVSFDGSPSSDDDGSIVQYEWDVDGDGGSEYSSSSSTVSHTYSSSGNYQAALTVIDDDGSTDTVTKTVTVSGTDDGGSITDIQATLSDTDGDGLDDSITVDVSVEKDGGATAVQFDAPFSLDLSETDESQAAIVQINDEQQRENVTFGSTGYTGTYTVKGSLTGQSDGDVGNVTAWIGDVSQGSASETNETKFTVESDTSPPSSGVSIGAPATVSPDSTFEVDTSVESDGGATVVQFDAPFSLNLSGTDTSQASVVSINDDQPNETVAFGGTGYTGIYTVDVKLQGGSDGDSIDIASWIGSLDRKGADAEATDSVDVSTGGTSNPFLDSNGQPLGEIQVVKILVSWNKDGRIDGKSYGEIELVKHLVAWNNARS